MAQYETTPQVPTGYVPRITPAPDNLVPLNIDHEVVFGQRYEPNRPLLTPDNPIMTETLQKLRDGYVNKDDRRAHNHYFKDVSKLKYIDVYRVLELFGVGNSCLQHAIKKLLVAGGRGAGKDMDRDVQEAIDSLIRYQEMKKENGV